MASGSYTVMPFSCHLTEHDEAQAHEDVGRDQCVTSQLTYDVMDFLGAGERPPACLARPELHVICSRSRLSSPTLDFLTSGMNSSTVTSEYGAVAKLNYNCKQN